MSCLFELVFSQILNGEESEKTGRHFGGIQERPENYTGVSFHICAHFFPECGECDIEL
jgi:hypothetical protein